MSELTDWKGALCCPECRNALRWDEEPCCTGCGARFELTATGVPLLLTAQDRERFAPLLAETSGQQMEVLYARRTRSDWRQRLFRALSPPAPVYHNPAEPPLPVTEGGLNLFLGGGGSRTPGFVNVDLAPFFGVDLVANAGRLPFAGESCDSVACDALLEHVADPVEVVAEIRRVLRPGGYVRAVVPFCHPWHGYPADYQRFSHQGLRWLFRDLECLSQGMRTGPTTTLLTVMLYYAKLVFPVHGGSLVRRWLNRVVVGAWSWGTAPLCYLDVWLNRLPEAHVLANHIYILAKKPDEPRSEIRWTT
ncbi:MAG: methyltransferase domain-containing protein [Vicinamibacteria bacterium]